MIPSGAADLQEAVDRFIKAVDQGDSGVVREAYAADFECWRTPDAGPVIRLDREVMLAVIDRADTRYAPSRSTSIDHIEVLDTLGIVTLRRVKDLGSGWETMFYCLLWRHDRGAWRFVREYVHQRSLPIGGGPSGGR